MKITVLSVGKIKESYLREGIAEYAKRLGRYCRLEMLEVEDERDFSRTGEAGKKIIQKKEGERLLKYIKGDAFIITLEIGGEQLNSIELSHKLKALGVSGISHIIFVIGGSVGLGEEVLSRSDYSLSFSKMTFPHQLMKLILLEQIYRSYRIMYKQPYHK